jgi:hypothetical protein
LRKEPFYIHAHIYVILHEELLMSSKGEAGGVKELSREITTMTNFVL